jgi:exosortase family protein XrtF
MKDVSFREFRPTIFFLGKFLGLYFAGNLLYGLFVTSFSPGPDPATRWVSEQTGLVLTSCGWPTDVYDDPQKATSLLRYDEREILAVYEGCNGLNTMIIFVAFLIAFGPVNKTLLWFIPLGLLIIHLANLLRITLLFFVAEYRPDFMYFIHKYIFTAILYLVIFALWVWWVKKFALKKSE